MTNWKFHIIAMCVIFGVSGLVFLMIERFSAPPVIEGQPDIVSSERVIFVSRASFGVNCNDYYDQMADRSKRFGTPIPDHIYRVKPNNILLAVTKRCNGKKTCTFSVNERQVGIKPITHCRPELDIEYRCFSYDRVWKETAPRDRSVTLDCS